MTCYSVQPEDRIFVKGNGRCVKSVQMRNYFWSVFSCIWTEYGPGNNSVFGHFSRIGVLSFATNIGKNIGKNISKSLSSKCSQKLIDHAKRSATDGFKTAPKKRFKKQQKQLVI